MSDDVETRLLSEVLRINAAVAALNPQLERLQATTSNINDRLGVVVETADAHELKIKQLEVSVAKLDSERQKHYTWRTRIGGMYVGIATFIGLTGGALAFYFKYLK